MLQKFEVLLTSKSPMQSGEHLPALLQKIRGKDVCVSLLFDKDYRYTGTQLHCVHHILHFLTC